MNTKTHIAIILTIIVGMAGFIAQVPPELQNIIPQLFPEASRAYVALICKFASLLGLYITHYFASQNKATQS